MKTYCIIMLSMVFVSCTKPIFKSKWVKQNSPEKFIVKFETTKGNFEIEVVREWSPKAADRFYQLVKHHFYNNTLFYRVVPKFVAQFGNSDTATTSKWKNFKVADEKVIYGNKKGSISFARGGKETRGRELFINLHDNSFLDTLSYEGVKGFPAFGNVTKGMEVIDSIYGGYGDNTMN